jgi:hypothetical protein
MLDDAPHFVPALPLDGMPGEVAALIDLVLEAGTFPGGPPSGTGGVSFSHRTSGRVGPLQALARRIASTKTNLGRDQTLAFERAARHDLDLRMLRLRSRGSSPNQKPAQRHWR